MRKMKNDYNGWSNYETWRVYLEVFDGSTASDFGWNEEVSDADTPELAEYLEGYVLDMVDETADDLVRGWATAFVSEVNWRECAEHMIDYSNE